MIYAQMYCTISELYQDLDNLGSEREAFIWGKLKAAADYLREELGHFIPVTLAKEVRQKHEEAARLYVPPLLSVTSIVLPNVGITLNSTDYVLGPDNRMWTNGPYTHLDRGYLPDNLFMWDCRVGGNVITGKWGMYEETEDTGATLSADQTLVQLAVAVNDGSKVSPGMVILLGSEQELVTETGSPTTGVTTLSAGLDASEELATLANGSAVKVGEIIRIGVEQCKVLDINSSTVHLARGWNKTQKAAHATSSPVDVYRTFNVLRGVNGTTPALHTSGSSVLRYVVPGDVNMLAREITGRFLKFARSGYAGKIGDENSGVSMYQSLIPKSDVMAVKANYEIPNAR